MASGSPHPPPDLILKRLNWLRQGAGSPILAEPEYHQTAGSVRLILPTHPVERALEARLPQEARDIARLLRDAGRLGTGEIIEATGRSRPWVLTQLRLLEEARVIERVGRGPRDPRAYWKLRVD